MKKIFYCLVTLLFIIGNYDCYAQRKLKGIVKDKVENFSLYGATIEIITDDGMLKQSTYVNFDGSFELKSRTMYGTLVVSMYGYLTKKIEFTDKKSEYFDFGTIFLKENVIIQKDIVVTTSSIDVIKDRKTPISSSTMRNYEMREKASNKDFIELTNQMPGVYTSRVGGGFGDTRMNVRGFEQNNISPMIDGIPVYDLEAGIVDWANISSMNDVSSSIQLQRGLGASKLVNSSVAGTMNMILRNANHEKGGFLYTSTGNDGYRKFVASYATGQFKNGFSTNFLISSTNGDGYIKATNFEAYSYYLAFGYNKGKNDLQFKVFGSPQTHNQRVSNISLNTFLDRGNGEPDYKYNRDWGYLNGEEYATKVNYGHKPLGIFQWDLNFNDKTQLSTKLYGSKGTSGTTNFSGGIYGLNWANFTDANGQIDLNTISSYNSGQVTYFPTLGFSDFRETNYNGQYINSQFTGAFQDSSGNTFYTFDSGISLVSEITNQTFYGGIINLKSELAKGLTINYGFDARKTVYNKSRIVNDLFGASGYSIDFYEALNVGAPGSWYSMNTSNTALPEATLDFTKKNSDATPVDYKYDAKTSYLGSYGQVEYDVWKFNLLAQGGFNRQFIQRVDYNLINGETNKTNELFIDGYNAKFGFNFNVTKKHNVWANAGFVSRPPVFVTVYSGLSNNVNTDYRNEKFKSIEVGYGFRSNFLTLNISAYSSDHKDAETPYYTPEDGNFGTTSGINRINRGVELDLTAAPIKKVILNGSLSIGDWKYSSNATFKVLAPDASGNFVPPSTLYINDHKIGGAPQLMASIGANYEVFSNFKFGSSVKYSDRMYASPSLERYDPDYYEVLAFKDPVRLPSFAVVDAFISYKFRLHANDGIDLRFNMDNVLNRKYISESNSSYQVDSIDPSTYDSSTQTGPSFKDNGNVYNGIATGNNALFGFGRTWNFTVRYEF